MHRHLVLIGALVALAGPAASAAQSPSEISRARAEAERERERERAQSLRDRKQEERDREDARREREQERRDRDSARDRERRQRELAGKLDTVVAFDARGTVSVSCPGGAVVVTAGSGSEIRVRARTESGGIRFTSNGTRAVLEPTSGRGCSDGRFEVAVPAGSRVTANTWSGSISVRGIDGDVEAHAQSGDIEIRDAGARVDVEALSGDVDVMGVKGDANVHTISGDIGISGARGLVDMESVSGDMTLRDVVTRQVRTQTTSGDVEFSGQVMDAGRYEFTTHSGEVRLSLPPDVGAQLSVSTFSGGIESDFPITLKPGEHGIGSAQSKRLSFTLGQGSARIIAETFSGDITLTSSARRR